ncbi:hypothetical protein ACN9MY_14115 [Pseudoduganella sp. R-31]|uniref:hypothetical protein n=1 Tax=unclassified Pseudoduganella TaxID=2637179 RepID=UPI003CF71910
MKIRTSMIALAAGIGALACNAQAAEKAGKQVAAADSQAYCFYQDQKFSEGAVFNGRVCSRSSGGKTADLVWLPQEGTELSGMLRELDQARLQTQLLQSRTILAETEARYNEAVVKLSGKK